MTATLIHGDQVSCSRLGGSLRRLATRLRQHAQSLEDAVGELAGWGGPAGNDCRAALAALLGALRTTAADLDTAGAALQRYSMDLAEGHELGRRAEDRVRTAGLLLEGTRVIEPWGPASAMDAEQRRTWVPDVQARVDLATAQIGRARGHLERELTRLADRFEERAGAVQAARVAFIGVSGSQALTDRL